MLQAVKQLFDYLGFPDVSIDETKGADNLQLSVVVSEKDSGVLIGHHGETINALQTIVSLMLNNGKKEYLPIELDINGYQAARKQSLYELATKAADNAVQSGREIILPPLSSRERRLIHVFLADREDVTTYSEGEGASRRLVVRPNAVG